jgi:hypothetical protein
MANQDPTAAVLEEILGEADELIRRRLQARKLEVPHLVVAVTPDGEVVLRSNVSPDVLRSFGKDLQDVADELEAPPKPGDTTQLMGMKKDDRKNPYPGILNSGAITALPLVEMPMRICFTG